MVNIFLVSKGTAFKADFFRHFEKKPQEPKNSNERGEHRGKTQGLGKVHKIVAQKQAHNNTLVKCLAGI